VDCYGQAASPEKREKVMKQIDVLTSAVRGIIAAGIPNVPLEIVVALAKEVGPHTVQANFQNGQMKSARYGVRKGSCESGVTRPQRLAAGLANYNIALGQGGLAGVGARNDRKSWPLMPDASYYLSTVSHIY
jgi:hypothetical protein